jgi:serine/threonine protein kinase/Tfp pilus assembly protein PilF
MARQVVESAWPASGPEDAPTGCQQIRLRYPDEVASWQDSASASVEHAEFFREVQTSDPKAARDFAQALATLPEVGTEFLGFRLLQELGRGGFGRVYLAQQGDLANRPVALKVAASLAAESQTLARLQHTNIVPIYSVHRAGPLQAVCMPYFGGTTLGHLLKDLSDRSAPPESGKDVVSTLHGRHSTLGPLESSSPSAGADISSGLDGLAELAGAPAVDPAGKSTAVLEKLESLSYVDAVLWIVARLGEGLAHAHERGIVHRDLKPANVLLADEGQPMLLDFNMAEDSRLRARASAALVGGTLPYMSPEQFEAYRGVSVPVDARSDLYSLGIILYELLTRRHPFPVHKGPAKKVLLAMREDRLQPPPRVRVWNPAVSPAVESIVRHCLQPDPARRYQSARELTEDLRRQMEHLPLKYAPEPSLRERVQKWVRRHPRLTSTSTVAAACAVVILGLAFAFTVRGKRVAELEAKDGLVRLGEDIKAVQFDLITQGPERDRLDKGVDECRKLLERYQVLDNPTWHKLPAVQALPPEEQGRLREHVGEMLLLWARAAALQAGGDEDRGVRAERLQFARRLNEQASACFDAGHTPRALLSQRADLSEQLGLAAEAKRLREEAQQTPLRTAKDHYLAAAQFVAQGRYRQAVPLIQKATQEDPANFWAWFVLGLCQDGVGDDEAYASYSISVALWPKFHWGYFYRGLTSYKQQRYQRACADFDQAIRLKPDLADAYVNRALAKQAMGDFPGAVADYTLALERGSEATRIYFMRSAARKRAKDLEGAQADLDQGLRLEPKDEKSWVARGMALLEDEPESALEDFTKALELNPRSLSALKNRAHVLAKQGRTEEAVLMLDKVVTYYPEYAQGRVDRGVLQARLQNWDAARTDAEEALVRDGKATTFYQAACVYAMSSVDNAGDRLRAVELLSKALRKGFGFDELEKDRDLDGLRRYPEFDRLAAAARTLRENRTGKSAKP